MGFGLGVTQEISETLQRLKAEATKTEGGGNNLGDVFRAINDLPQSISVAMNRVNQMRQQDRVEEEALAELRRRQQAIQQNPQNAFGGPDLIGVANTLPESQRGKFTKRIQLLGLLKRVRGDEYINQIGSYRERLDNIDTETFDQQFFDLLERDVQRTLDAIDSPTGQLLRPADEPRFFTKNGRVVGEGTPGAEAHFFDSPEAEKLMKGFYESIGVPFEAVEGSPRKILTEDEELRASFTREIDRLIEQGVLPKPKRDAIADGAIAARRQGAQLAAEALAPVVSQAVGGWVPGTDVTLIPGVTQGQVHDATKRAVEALVMEGTSGPAIASYFVPVAGPTARLALSQRVAVNALLGGLTNMGIDVAQHRTDINTLALDFSIGAFGGAALPEVMWAFTRSKGLPTVAEELGVQSSAVQGVGPKYSRESVQAILDLHGNPIDETMIDEFGHIRWPGEPTPPDPNIPARVPKWFSLNRQSGPVTESVRDLETRLQASIAVAEDFRRQAYEMGRQYRATARLRDQARRAALGQAGPVRGSERIVSGDDVFSASLRAMKADAEATALAQRLADARIEEQARATAQKLADRTSREAQAITQQTIDTARILEGYTDPLNSPNALRRFAARINAAVTGKNPGAVGVYQAQAAALRSALDFGAQKELDELADRVDDVLSQEIDDIFYIGPIEHRDAAIATKLYTVAQHPEWWSGISPAGRRVLQEYQDWANARVELLTSMGYPIKALEGEYVPQFWDMSDDAIAGAGEFRGRVGAAKGRAFPDYVTGVEAGWKPRDLTLGQTLKIHTKMMHHAMSEAWERRLVLDTYGKTLKGKQRPPRGWTRFQSPLFAGYIAPNDVVAAVDSAHKIQPWLMRGMQQTSQRFKNTAFGLFDLAIFGVQLPHMVVFGTPRLLAGTAIQMANQMGALPEWQVFDTLTRDPRRAELFSRHGLGIGRAIDTGLTPEANSIFSLIPNETIRNVDEATLGRWSRFLSKVQFDLALSRLKMRMMEGELFFQHLAGNNIRDAKVLRNAADVTNALSLTSRPAQSGLRRATENIALTSANALRAEVNTMISTSGVVPVAKAILSKKLNHPELVSAAVSVVSFAFTMQVVANTWNNFQGKPNTPFSPFDGDWGTIYIGNKKVPIIKERSIIRGVAKSWEALQREDPWEVAAIWEQVFMGRLSPFAGIAPNAAGHGFDPETGRFRAPGIRPGDQGLSFKARTLNIAPFSPLIDSLIAGQTDYDGITLETLGLNNWDISSREELDAYVRANNPYPADDPRHAVVNEKGYSGLWDQERLNVRAERPDLFTGKLEGEAAAAAKLTQEKYDRLRELEAQVEADPFKRREYQDLRSDVVQDVARGWKDIKIDREPQNIQAEAKDIYYATIDEYREIAVGDVLKGEAFGEAEKAARERVFKDLGQDGLDALDASLIAGVTKLEQEYLKDRKTIEDSGYWDINDQAIVYLQSKLGGNDFTTYGEFLEANDDFAKEKGIEPEETAAYKQIQKLIERGKQRFREQHPEIDGLLSIWYGNKPLTTQAQDMASERLQRTIDLSSDADTPATPTPRRRIPSAEEILRNLPD